MPNTDPIAELHESLKDGSLTMRQAVGLTDAEMAALRQTAARLARRGKLGRASRVLGMLCSFDPLDHRNWRAFAKVHRLAGRQVEETACTLVAATLAPQPVSRDQGVRV